MPFPEKNGSGVINFTSSGYWSPETPGSMLGYAALRPGQSAAAMSCSALVIGSSCCWAHEYPSLWMMGSFCRYWGLRTEAGLNLQVNPSTWFFSDLSVVGAF